MGTAHSEEMLLKLFRKSLKEFRRDRSWNTYQFHYNVDNFKQTIKNLFKEKNPLIISNFVKENDYILTKKGSKMPYATCNIKLNCIIRIDTYDYGGEEYYDNLERHRVNN